MKCSNPTNLIVIKFLKTVVQLGVNNIKIATATP